MFALDRPGCVLQHKWGRTQASIDRARALLQAHSPFLKSWFVLISALARFSAQYQDGLAFTLILSPGLANLMCEGIFLGRGVGGGLWWLGP